MDQYDDMEREHQEEVDQGYENYEDIGALLKRLRGRVSLREVTRRTGVSASYLSQIERGVSQPGANVVRKLAELTTWTPRRC